MICSNIRLHQSFSCLSFPNGDTSDIHKHLALGNWDEYLVQEATKLAMTIQNISPSDISEIPKDEMTDDKIPKDHARDDVNWIETVVFLKFIYLL